MSIRPIHSPDDVRGIEAHPFEAYLRYTSVMHALETQEAKHPSASRLSTGEARTLTSQPSTGPSRSSWP